MIQALIQIQDPTYTPSRWQTTLLTIAASTAFSIVNIFAAGRLSLLEGTFAICHVFAFVPVAVMLWVLAPKASTEEVFFQFRNGGDWPCASVSIMVGQISAIFITLGSDSVAHIAEEVEDAARIVPHSMVCAYVLNAPLTLIMLITICFNLGSVELALESGYPFV